MNASDLIRIMQFGDSVLPVGAFTFSNGVESAIQTGVVRDVPTLKGFVLTALKQRPVVMAWGWLLPIGL